MAMTSQERQRLLVLAILVAVAAGAAFWIYWRAPSVARAGVLRDSVETLTAEVANARRDLARGTVEDLQASIRYYEATLERLRELAPDPNEVTTLIDDISRRSRERGIAIGELAPLTVDRRDAFEVHRYRFTVYGHYDEIGGFLSDIATLRRVMVPSDLSLVPADPVNQRTFGDTTGALIQARFQLHTFVKPVNRESGAGGAP